MKPLKRALKVLLLTLAAYLIQVCVMRYFLVRSVVGNVIFAVLAIIVVTCGKKYAFCSSCLIGMMMESMLSNSNVPSLYVIAYPAITMLCAQTFADMTDRQLEQRRLAYERRQVRISQGKGKSHWWHSFSLRSRDTDLPPLIRIPLCAGEMDLFLNLVLIFYMYLIGEELTLIHVYRLAGSIIYTMSLAVALMYPCRKLLGMYPRRKQAQGGEEE
ncbi:MAG: hypothetical protein IKH30_19180 [Clostridia bacterium]|nr:hypothetical protein [Clostridia bacterium]